MTDKKVTVPSNMAVIDLGIHEYVLPVKEATAVIQALEKAERYHKHYRRDDEGGNLYFVWQDAPTVRMSLISGDEYLQGKYAGKFERT